MVIDNIAFNFLGFNIYWYGLVYSLGFILGYFFLMFFAKKYDLNKEHLENIFIYSFIFGLIGGRVFEIIFYNFSYYFLNPIKIFAIWEGGMAIHGSFLFGFLSVYYFSNKYKIDYLKVMDLISVPYLLITSFGRLANFINQELVGKVTNSAIGVVFPSYDNQLRYPSTLFESIKNMISFQIVFYLFYFKNLKPGLIFAISFMLYNFLRFFIGFFREPDVSLGIISMGQLLSLLFGFLGLYLFIKINNSK